VKQVKSDTTEATKGKKELKVITTKSGLKYIDLVVGKGEEAVKGTTVEMHYTGWLEDKGEKGKKFDSSHDSKRPYTFKLGAGKVIKGWDEGIVGMKTGGKRRLIIPSKLGYGARSVGGGLIPPNSNLIFDVEFLKILKK